MPALNFAPPPETTRTEVEADLDTLVGPEATAFDQANIRRLRLDLLTNAVVVEYAGEMGTDRLTIPFATAEAADAYFTRLWRRLGDSFALAPHSRDTWSLVRGPLLLLLGVLVIVAVCVGALSVIEDAGPRPVAIGFDWKMVCALGGTVAALSQVWLYRRITSPPVALELIRS